MKLALLAIFLALPLVGQTLVNPSCPNATAAAGVMPHCVTLTWVAPTNGATGYNIYRETTSGTCKTSLTATGCTKVTATPVTATTFTDNSSTTNALSEGVTYFYVATSLIGSGESAPSTETSGTFPAIVPTAPSNLSGVFH